MLTSSPSIAVTIVLLLFLQFGAPVFAQQSTSTLYFHDNSELIFTHSSFQFSGFQVSNIEAGPTSTSARIFQTATASPPTGNGIAVPLSANISVSGEGYLAFVAWVSNPFPINVTLDGNVIMHVWMASNDSLYPWQGSEFFMGVADYYASTGSLQVLDDYVSNATAGYNGFTGSPNEYVISTLHITQHQFQAGSTLLFFAGAGSNKQDFSFTVYFDSPTWASRADIPADPTLTVAEFPTVAPLAIIVLLLTFSSRSAEHLPRPTTLRKLSFML
jgi:hypothetical protein